MASDRERYLENWQAEVDSAAEYLAMAEAESDPRLAQVYRSLAKTEERHIDFWENHLRRAGHPIPRRRPRWQSRLLIWVAKKFGPQMILKTITDREQAGQNSYLRQGESKATAMAGEERWHTLVLSQIGKTSASGEGGLGGSGVAQLEGRHHNLGGNALRAAILGANDGLCSNLSLVMGVAGAASANERAILVAGTAGLLAGAFSMALGEWVSVTSSRELAEREIRVETSEVEYNPAGEEEELRLIYEAKGLSEADARGLARQILSNKGHAIDTMVREELGLDPGDPGGSPMQAAIFSFLFFVAGAIVPVYAFTVLNTGVAFVASLVSSAVALFGFGALITVFTGRSVFVSGMRQVLLGLISAGVTFALGHLLGVALGR